ncbi:hypothetical protein L9F63_023819, partial [Diploptera punctata]
ESLQQGYFDYPFGKQHICGFNNKALLITALLCQNSHYEYPLQYQRPLSPSSAVFTTVNFFFC